MKENIKVIGVQAVQKLKIFEYFEYLVGGILLKLYKN